MCVFQLFHIIITISPAVIESLVQKACGLDSYKVILLRGGKKVGVSAQGCEVTQL